MRKNKQNTSFESLTDWIKHNGNHHPQSRGLEKVLKRDEIDEHIKANQTPDDNETISHFGQNDASPHVELVKDGDVISGIRIECVCGKTINIDLEYNEELETLIYKKES